VKQTLESLLDVSVESRQADPATLSFLFRKKPFFSETNILPQRTDISLFILFLEVFKYHIKVRNLFSETRIGFDNSPTKL